jgi:chemosensory pili system protein ChpA (sensor histidine kinase/response regulator)
VLDLQEARLSQIRADGEVEWLGNRYPYHFLPQLLGDDAALPEARRQYWLLLLRSGTQRVAVQVDELRGNREIVVKNVGAQLSRVVGIAGATVLGDGRVVLILNPVALASRARMARIDGVVAHIPAEARHQPLAPLPTVLVVDDSLTVRKITSRLLTREGYRVLTAKDGVDALEQMLDTVPDVLLADIEMPRMDGFDLVRNVRADEKLKHVPVIMITSRTAEKHRKYAFEIGVNHYLGKPYDEDELLALVGECTKT